MSQAMILFDKTAHVTGEIGIACFYLVMIMKVH